MRASRWWSSSSSAQLAENRRIGFKASTSAEIDPGHERHHVVERALTKQFKPEFLNRIDAVVVFQWLNHDDLRRILHGLVGDLNLRLNERHRLTLELAPEAADLLIARGWDPKYGARPLRRALRREQYQPLARSLLRQGWPEGQKLIAEREGDALGFRLAVSATALTAPAPLALRAAAAESEAAPAPRLLSQDVGSN